MTSSSGTTEGLGVGRVSVRTCGGLLVTGADASLGPRDLGGVKPRLVLVALLLDPGRPVGRDRLAHLLWGDRPPAGYDGTLAAYVSLLRKRLGAVGPGAGQLVQTVSGGYVIDDRVLDLDTWSFTAQVADARAASRVVAALTAYDAALDTVDRPWLAGDDSVPWLQDERRLHDRRVAAVLREASALALRSGDVGRAELWARRLLELEPFDETAWRILLEALDGQDRPADGLREYVVCRQLFADELGCAPGPQVREVFERLLHQTRSVSSHGLDVLVDAVLRLYDAPAAAATGGGRARGEVERACGVLEDLLVRTRGLDQLRAG
jgi:SARP family transcriptional regulator, regulator of embCAB operon